MWNLYWAAFKRMTLRLLDQPKWLFLLCSLSIMSLVYINGTVSNLPVAVVDLDHSPASRDLIRALNTSAKVDIQIYEDSLTAYDDINHHKLFAVITIPHDYQKKLLNRETVSIPAYGDGSSRLANGMIQQDFRLIFQQLLLDYNQKIMHTNGFSNEQVNIILMPIKAQTEALYNGGLNLAAITFPGLLVMLLQHSLLIAGTRTNIALNTLPQGKPPKIIFLGSLSALIPIWLFLSLILYVLWPWFLGYRQLASIPEVLLMTFPFLLAVIGLSKLLTECLRRVEMIYLTLALLTTPVFYLSGTVWPIDAMPYPVQLIGKLLPSTWAVNMVASVNQMGLSLNDNLFNIFMLLVLGAVYASIGIFISALRDGRLRHSRLIFGRKHQQHKQH